MKYTKVLRIFSIAIILSMLAVAVPATPAQALGTLTLVPDEGKIGDEITVVGEGFNVSTETTERSAILYLSREVATPADDIDDDITVYEIVKSWIYLDEDGEFGTTTDITFDVPAELNDGEDEDEYEDVTSGTYYVSLCYYLPNTNTLAPRIRAVAEFTLVGGEIEVDPESGLVGTEVEVAGIEFSAENEITIEYDGDEVDIESGDDETDEDGEFYSYIIVPESTAGDHTITVTVSGGEVEAEFTVEPEIFLSPVSGEPGEKVDVSGTGFGRRKNVVVYLDGKSLTTVTSDSSGSFKTTFNVPADLGTDIYDVEVEDEDENMDSAKFTVTAPPPPSTGPTPEPSPSPTPTPSATTVSINANNGPIGAQLVLGGSGFEAGGTVTIKYDGEEVDKVSADASGIFVAAFQVPAGKSGARAIVVTDGTNTHELTYTVESTPPGVPAPLLPEMGVKVKSPVSFDWEDVKDASLPVVYTLQVATDKEFTDASLVVDKDGLESSEYAFTESEELRLVSSDTPYYWRVKATDGASNESAWTGAGMFYFTPPTLGGLPSWALYALFGLGGLVLFIVGYLVGRRTAYYY
ncbi:MAG TPA: hypothetical protein VMW00_02920 [Dehalococcoidales bacterium]|nr:hypothetical protein [Dehalococcoidales bacterium]